MIIDHIQRNTSWSSRLKVLHPIHLMTLVLMFVPDGKPETANETAPFWLAIAVAII